MRRWILVGTALVVGLSGCVSSNAEVPTESSVAARSSSSADPGAGVRVAMPGGPTPTMAVDLDASLQAATGYAADRGITVGIAVLDRATGQETTNGATAGRQMWSASLAKLFLADDLLFRDRAGSITLADDERVLIRRMLESSDDSAADTLYVRYGAENMVTEVSRRYGLPGISASTDAGEWELTNVAAASLVRWYDRFLTTAATADRDLLVGLLQGAEPVAADGFEQTFGLPTAVTGQSLAYKQGWMCCPAATSFLHTTAVVGTDLRFVVAVLTERPSDSGYATDALTRITQLAFPAGVFAP